jgi:hypothetical protein
LHAYVADDDEVGLHLFGHLEQHAGRRPFDGGDGVLDVGVDGADELLDALASEFEAVEHEHVGGHTHTFLRDALDRGHEVHAGTGQHSQFHGSSCGLL